MRLDIRNNALTVGSGELGMNFLARRLESSPAGAVPLQHISLAANAIHGIDGQFVPGMSFSSGSSGVVAQTADYCANLASPGAGANVVNGTPGVNVFAYTLRHRQGTTFELQGFTGNGTSEAAVESFVQSNNSGGNLGGATDAFSAGGTTIFNYTGGTCETPLQPTLP